MLIEKWVEDRGGLQEDVSCVQGALQDRAVHSWSNSSLWGEATIAH